MKELKPRYTICTIISTDMQLKIRAMALKDKGHTHEAIYRAGLDVLDAK